MPSWFSRWSLSSPALLGIDLDPPHARLVACVRRRRSWRVTHCAEVPLDPSCLQDSGIGNFDELARRLKDLVHSAGGGSRIALALPVSLVRRQPLLVPPQLRPWQWRQWLGEQAQQMAAAPAEALVCEAEILSSQPLRVLLCVALREQVEDWQGLAEAAGLELALLDDRPRVARLALAALTPRGWPGTLPALALATETRCRVIGWSAEGTPWEQNLTDPEGQLPAGGWLVGSEQAHQRWLPVLQDLAGGHWPRLNVAAHPGWQAAAPGAKEPGDFLVALGLALRPWHP